MIASVKDYLTFPWLLSVPLLLAGFAFSVFFVGTDSVLLAPAILCILGFAFMSLWSYARQGAAVAIPHSNTFIFAMFFWLWLALSLFWSTTPYVSTIFTIIIGLLPGIFAVCVLAPQAEKWVRMHALALWLTIGAFAVWALIQFFFLYEQYGPRINHPMLNPNNLAGLFNMGLFPAMGLFLLARRRLHIVLAGALLVLFYFALIVTQSRGAFYACVLATFILVPVITLRRPDGFPWPKILFIAVVGSLIPFIGDVTHPGGLHNLVGEAAGNTRSMVDRFHLWGSTWEMIKDNFLFGTGLASFFFYYPRYRHIDDRSDGFFAHMDPLQFWAETGIMAPIFFYGVLICVLLRTIAAVKAAGPDIKTRIEVMAPFCGMLALTGHTHMTFHLYMPGMLIPLSLALAYWYMATERALGDAKNRHIWQPPAKHRLAAVGAVVVIAILAGGWVSRTSAATYMMGEVQRETALGNRDLALRKLYLTGLIAPGSYGRYYEYEARFRLSQLWDHAKTMDKAAVRKLYDEALYYLDEAEARNPAFTTLWDLRARLHFVVNGILINDGDLIAIELLQRAIQANPLAADSRVMLANIYKSRGEFQNAMTALESGVRWPRPKGRTDLTFLITLAQLKQQLGDKAAHDAYMNEARKRARSYGMTIQ